MKKMKMKIANLTLETKIMVGGGLIGIGLMPFSIVTADPIKYILGVLFGGLFSILNFRLTQVIFEKAMKMPSAKAQIYVQTRYLLRFLMTGVVIYVAIIIPWLNIIGVILGLIVVKISVLINQVLLKKNVSRIEV